MTDIADPFAENVDEDDPFATSDDVKGGGSFTPSPKFDDLEGRLIALVPRIFTKDAPKAEQFQKDANDTTQERWEADMAVLDGGPLQFEYKGPPVDKGDREILTATVEKLPALFEGTWRFEQAVIGQLSKVSGTARPVLLGRVVRGPKAKDKKAGKTIEDIRDAFTAWRKNPRGPMPGFSWQIDVDGVTDTDKETARRWLKSARADGFVI